METIKLLPSSKKINASSFLGREKKEDGGGNLSVISEKVIRIEKLLGGQNKLLQNRTKNIKKQEELSKRKKGEEKLEEKPKDKEEKDGRKLLKGPRLGFLDRIKNFLGKMILGFIAVRLIPYLPQLLQIVPKIAAVNEFFIDTGIGLVDGFATFVNGAYELRDKTLGFIKGMGGDFAVDMFKNFEGVIGKVLEAAIIVAMSAGGEGGLLDTGGELIGDFLKKRATQAGAQAATQAGGGAAQAGGGAAQAGGIGAGAVAGIVAGAGLLASALGEGAFQLKKLGQGLESGAKKRWEEKKIWDPRKPLDWAIWQGSRFINFQLGLVGGLLDIVGAPFRYAIELLRYPFLSEEDKKKQATNLAKFDARVRENLRQGLNMLTLGLAFKEKGSFGNIFGNQGAQKQMMSKMAGGGITRGGRTQGAISRTVKKKEIKRVVKPTKTQLKPGKNVGGEEKIEKIFPESKKREQVSPLGYIKETYDTTNEIPFFGPIFDIAYKTLLGNKPNSVDYKNVSFGLNSWMNDTFDPNVMRSGGAFAGGGEVNAEMFMKGSDLTGVIAKSVEESIASKVDDAIADLQKQLGLKSPTRPAGVPGPSEAGPLDTVNIQGGDADFWTLVAVASREDGEPQAWADVAQSIYNRLASGAYTGKTIKELILGQMQYEPTWKFPRRGATGRPNPEWFAIKDAASAGVAAGQSEEAMKKVAAAILDANLQKNAREFIQGRTDFRGYSVSGGIQRKSGDNYYGWYNNYRANKVGSVPNFGATATSTGGGPGGTFVGGGTGSGYGSGGVKIAGDLGDYMKANKGKIGVTGSIHQHPRHPQLDKRNYFSYHNQGRALDIGGYGPAHPSSGGRDEQAPVIRSLLEWNKKNGYKPVEIIHGSPAFKGLGKYESAPNALHSHHVHVAYARGGLVRGFTKAILGERGVEFVLDNDTTVALQKTFPGFLDALNRANFNDAVNVLRNYASYEVGAMQEVQINNNIINIMAQDSAPQTIMIGGDGGMDDFAESMAAGQ